MNTYFSKLRKQGVIVDGIKRLWNPSKSKGSYLCESETNKMFLDFHTGYGSLPLGWNHPKLVEKSKLWKTSILVNKLSNSDIYTEEYLDYLETFNNHVNPTNFNGGMFLVDAGTLAVDNAIKACFDYKKRGDINNEKELEVLYLSHSFHGRSGYPLSITDSDKVKIGGYPKFKWPQLYMIPLENDEPRLVTQALNLANEVFIEKRDTIAAVIMEGGIQCEGGDRHLNKTYCQSIVNMCKINDIPVIIDEVQTGFWSTGKTWGYQHLDIEPDIIAFGKKSSQCGITAGGVFNDYTDSVFKKSSRINSTWGGNIIDMIRCKDTLDIIIEDDLGENVNKLSKIYLDELKKNTSPIVKNIRAKGVLMAFDLPNEEIRNKFVNLLEIEGLLCLKAGLKTIRLRPPLSVNYDELNHGIDIIVKVSKEIDK